MFKGKGKAMDLGARQKMQQTPFEAESRRVASFEEVESKLARSSKPYASSEETMTTKATSLLGSHNPFAKKANPKDNEVWVLDNTAYRPVHPTAHDPQPWQAEFVACFFHTGRKDIGKFVSIIADQLGLDGKAGENAQVTNRIRERIYPFIAAISPSRTLDIQIPCPTGQPHVRTLGPSNHNGISSQIVLTGGGDKSDGTTIDIISVDHLFPNLKSQCHFAGPEGWAIVSDIDDTIKITHSTSPIGTLQTTFAEEPQTTEGLPEFYKILHEQFKNPAWIYLSASPYNLYPFLHKFLQANYPRGTMILRDASWMYFGGLLQSLTQGVQAYKVDRLNKVHDWIPKRKLICIGDSTQSDPESYAEIYRKYPGWVHAIYIRKVLDDPFMEEKNKDERFLRAFQGVPSHVWKVFVKPDELADHVKHVEGAAHMGIAGMLQGYFCKTEQSIKKQEVKDTAQQLVESLKESS